MTDEPARYERRDFSPRVVQLSALGLVLTCILLGVGVWILEKGLDRFFAYRGTATWTSSPTMVAPSPQLQTNVARDLVELRAEEDAILHGYGWVDRRNGVIRIPIDVAMRLTAERGLPVRKPEMPATPP